MSLFGGVGWCGFVWRGGGDVSLFGGVGVLWVCLEGWG